MKSGNAGILFIVGMWLVYVILCIGTFAGIAYTAMHFIRKYW